MACEEERAALSDLQNQIQDVKADLTKNESPNERTALLAQLEQLGKQEVAAQKALDDCLKSQPPPPPPLLLPHILEISQVNGTPWVNPAFNTNDPGWSSLWTKFDGSTKSPFEWVSVLNPTVEQDDEVGGSRVHDLPRSVR